MVGNNINDDAHAQLVCSCGKISKTLHATELFIDGGGINDIVAMIGIWHGRKNRGEVQVADA